MRSPSPSEPDASGRHARRSLIAVAATLAVLVPLGWWWWSSLTPSTYSVMDMGYMDYGGGAAGAAGHAMPGMPGMETGSTDVASLTGPRTGTPDVAVQLVAAQGRVRLASGQMFDGYTLNGSSPGPLITARQGDLLQVTLVNRNVSAGVTLHWHGVDVPNAEDGVAGVTQEAVPPGGRHVYRFVAADAGTYWYHSHQDSADQVKGGLLGPLVIRPRTPAAAAAAAAGVPSEPETIALVHTYDGHRTVNGTTGVRSVRAASGSRVRVRLINTDNGPLLAWVTGTAYRVLAVDGHELNGPGEVTGRTVEVPAGGRYDVEVTVPPAGPAVRVDVGGGTAITLGPSQAAPAAAAAQPAQKLDLLGYGTARALPFDAGRPDRRFEYRVGRRPGLIDGRPGFWWTVNGHLFPDVPMFMVATGDVVTMRIENSSGQMHPMHLHGHHAVVLSRDGVRATGSPWWVDSLNVADGQSYEIAFLADNPGIWMDHCHNLDHAAQGLLAHFAYEGVSESYAIGHRVADGVENAPE